jgi:hypothetical protein
MSFQGRSSSAAAKQVGQFQLLETIGEGQYGEAGPRFFVGAGLTWTGGQQRCARRWTR